MEMVARGDYFTINRARQYGKTTTLLMLARSLPEEYTCISLSFEGVGGTMFTSPASFCQRFLFQIANALENTAKDFARQWIDETVTDFDLLGYHLDRLCKEKKIVLMIDEIDKMSNNEVFLHFLGMLRSKYLARQAGTANTFHSVLLVGVYDIRNIKLKLINEGVYTPATMENKLYNSPWNIAANFEVNLSFDPGDIATMLTEYEADHNTGMSIPAVAEAIFDYTSGYPFLVSRICRWLDLETDKNWTYRGVQEAVQFILREKNTLFDDLIKNLEGNPKLADFIFDLLFIGQEYDFNIYDPLVELGVIFGFLKANNGNKVCIANRVFELQLHNYFVSKKKTSPKRITGVLQRDVVDNGRFDMELCLRKFAAHYAEIFNEHDAQFIEREGRLLFLSYLKPLINGQGFYHIESQFTDLRRMDLVVDFGLDQFIIELKLWKGEEEHKKAYAQLSDYLEHKDHSTGYLLTFDFRKSAKSKPYAKWVNFDGKRIFDVVVNTATTPQHPGSRRQ